MKMIKQFLSQVHILGGGPAGLAAAYFAKSKGLNFKLIEGSSNLGGNCRTLKLGDCLFDTGAHRFHDKDPETTRMIKNLLGDDLIDVSAPSQIFYQNSFVNFPLNLANLVEHLDKKTLLKVVLESLSLRPQPQSAKNFADFAQNQYGPTLSKLFLLNYTEKLWGLNADLLSTNVAGGRLKGLNLKTFIRESFLWPEKSTKHIDGRFLYPKYGFGMIVDKLTEIVSLKHIETGCRVTKIQHSKRKIESIVINNNQRIPVCQIINTLPLTLTLQILEPAPPSELIDIAKSIQFRHLILLAYCINRESLSQNASIYFPDPQLPFTRLYEPKNRSKQMAPKTQTAIVLELPCNQNDSLWHQTEVKLQDQIWQMFQDIFPIRSSEIQKQEMYKLPFAYPVLTVGFESKVARLIDYCKQFDNMYLTGRNALFQYLHLHDLFKRGRTIVNQLSD